MIMHQPTADNRQGINTWDAPKSIEFEKVQFKIVHEITCFQKKIFLKIKLHLVSINSTAF